MKYHMRILKRGVFLDKRQDPKKHSGVTVFYAQIVERNKYAKTHKHGQWRKVKSGALAVAA